MFIQTMLFWFNLFSFCFVFCFLCYVFIAQPEHPKTQCEHHRDSVQTGGPVGYPTVGAYVPQCDDNGLYRPLQVGV